MSQISSSTRYSATQSIQVPLFHKSHTQKYLSYYGPKFYNLLPIGIKCIQNWSSFKKQARQYINNHYNDILQVYYERWHMAWYIKNKQFLPENSSRIVEYLSHSFSRPASSPLWFFRCICLYIIYYICYGWRFDILLWKKLEFVPWCMRSSSDKVL